MTIREAIKQYEQMKATYLGREYLDVVKNTSLCIIIPLKNGVRFFIDSNPEMEYFKKRHFNELPNKYGVFKRISFTILNDKKPNIPESMKEYLVKSNYDSVLYFVENAKEKAINEFIQYNEGIDEELYLKDLKEIWDKDTIKKIEEGNYDNE